MVHSYSSIDSTTVWNKLDTNDAECLGLPNLAENTKNLHKFILADRKLNLLEIAEGLKIESSVFTMNNCQ